MDITPHEDIPEEVTKLGGPLAVFQGGRLVTALCWIIGILALLAGLAGLGLFGFLMMEGPGQGANARGSGKLLFLGILSLSGGIGLIRKARSARGLRVFVCTEGIVMYVQDVHTTVMRWEDINSVQRTVDVNSQRLVISTAAQLILKDRQGQEWVFNETLSDLRRLREMIEEHTLKFMLPPALEALQRGASIGFGEISVSPDGIHCGRETLPWDLFDGAEVAKGRLNLYSRNRKRLFGRVELTKVPNYHVLMALVEHSRAGDHD
jgi:hypothetical protein